MKILSTDYYYFSCCNSMLIPNTQTANWQKKRISITEWETGRFREVCLWMLIFFNVKKKIRTNEQLNDLKYLVQTCFVTKFVYCRSFSSVSFRRHAFDYSTSSSLFRMCVCLSVFFLFLCVSISLKSINRIFVDAVLSAVIVVIRCALIKSNSNWLTKKTTMLNSVCANCTKTHFAFSIQSLLKCNYFFFNFFFKIPLFLKILFYWSDFYVFICFHNLVWWHSISLYLYLYVFRFRLSDDNTIKHVQSNGNYIEYCATRQHRKTGDLLIVSETHAKAFPRAFVCVTRCGSMWMCLCEPISK